MKKIVTIVLVSLLILSFVAAYMPLLIPQSPASFDTQEEENTPPLLGEEPNASSSLKDAGISEDE